MKKLFLLLLLAFPLITLGKTEIKSGATTALHIFPQPVQAGESIYLQWSTNESQKLNFQLFDILGNRMYQAKLSRLDNGSFRFDFPQRPRPGYYFVQVESEGLQARQRIQVN